MYSYSLPLPRPPLLFNAPFLRHKLHPSSSTSSSSSSYTSSSSHPSSYSGFAFSYMYVCTSSSSLSSSSFLSSSSDVPTLTLVVSVLPLGRFLASIFSTLSCFLPFSLVPHTTILSETRSAYPIVSFPSVFFLSSDPLSPPSEGFCL